MIVGGEPTMIVASRHSGPGPSSQVILYIVVAVSTVVGLDPDAGGFAVIFGKPRLLVIIHCPGKYPDVVHESVAVPPEKMTGGLPSNEMIFPEIVTEFEHAVS